MFNKPKDATPEQTTTAAVPIPAAPLQAQPAPKRTASARAAPSIISADLVVTGTLSSTGDMQVDGRVEGDVHSAALVVGEKAVIQGEIIAEEVTVRGRVEGSIRARKILLCSTCHVEGNILHEAFSVEAGAFFEGNCRHSDNPTADDGSRRNAALERRPLAASLSTPTNGGAPIAAKALDSGPSRPAAGASASPAA
ncbi:MAG: polymer-forming cytoskeletal protein [Alphaproteobacteria bacterium]|nr:polymer-forming cytoskeletal protein [Alphaproteobacteria bacterium]MBV9062163.1 polymer-forming cytoskeletal protein [Alphaproteobacteria bacterium]